MKRLQKKRYDDDNNKQTYVSQLPLANKSILYQGHFVSSVFVDHPSVDSMLAQSEINYNLKVFSITSISSVLPSNDWPTMDKSGKSLLYMNSY